MPRTGPKGVDPNHHNANVMVKDANGNVVSYDLNSRLSSLQVSQDILSLAYTYDDNNNITGINDKGKIKTYVYDENNQLIQAVTPDKFLAPAKLNGASAQAAPDFKGTSWMDYMQVLPGMMGLDYHAKSIGIDFGVVIPKLKQIKLVPGEGYQNHRITEENLDHALDLYTSLNNSVYTLIPHSNLTFEKNNTTGVITISFNSTLSSRYLKVHVKFDDRDIDGNARDSAQFLNELARMMEVYQESDSRTEEYQYDAAGNRKLLKVTLVQTENYYSYYYSNSDRLKTDGKYAFDYDAAGNLTRKGNRFDISGDVVTFTTSGEGVEFWEYEYDLLNRLISVRKNGNIVSEYAYDPEGLRVVKRKYVGGTLSDTTHYVFEGTEPIFEKRISDSRVRSYVFAFGKHLARVDGVIGDANAVKYFYHTDHVGSVRAVSNGQGQVVWSADYLAFGSRYGKEGTFEEERGFGGKEYDSDTGLYYFNARWYDSELGRFISEDPAMDPNNPNLYSYCGNNPLSRLDLSGLDWYTPGTVYNDDGSTTNTSNDLTTTYSDKGKNDPTVTISTHHTNGIIETGAWHGNVQSDVHYSLGLPDFTAPNGKEQYLDFWNNVPRQAFQYPELVKSLLGVMWQGIGTWGTEAMPCYGWGSAYNTDNAHKNMVRAIQAAVGGIGVDGKFGLRTVYALNNLFSNYSGNIVGQGLTSRLIERLNGSFIWPTQGVITSRFGPRKSVIIDWKNGKPIWSSGDKSGKPHQGLDIANNDEDVPIFGVKDGTVIFAGHCNTGGNCIVLDHGAGLYTYYFHINSFNCSEGQKITQGQQIAIMGNTGCPSQGRHLHFAVSTGGTKFDGYQNPELYLPQR